MRKMEIDQEDNNLNEILNSFSDTQPSDVEFTKKCFRISTGVSNNTFTILQLVEDLGILLINPDASKRELGVEILTHVLECLPDGTINSEQLNYLTTFYADRLKDNYKVIPAALRGALALIKCRNFPDGAATVFLSSLFQNLSCQQQQCAERMVIYRIFEVLLERKIEELKIMKYDFVYGFISAMDGERDPKVLIFLFNWLPKLLTSLEFGHLLEEMFEVVACYFPVDFKAPSQDPNAISRERLSEALAPCLCAIPEFAQFCLPLALEKLDSNLHIAKIDSLHLLREGCKNFNSSDYYKFSTEIWSAIYKELLQNEKDLEFIALDVLTAVINKLSDIEENSFKDYLKNIIDTTKGNLLPDSKLFDTSCKILLHISKACKQSASFTIKEIVPILTNTLKIAANADQKAKILQILVCFFKTYFNLFNSTSEELNPVPVLCMESVVSKDVKLQTTGLQCLAIIAKNIPQEIRLLLYENLKLILVQTQAENLRKAAVYALETFADSFPKEIQENVIAQIKYHDLISLRLYLNAIGYLAAKINFTEIVLPIMVENSLKTIQESTVAFACLREVLERENTNDFIRDFIVYNLQYVPKVTEWAVGNLSTANPNENEDIFRDISAVLSLLIGDLNSEKQKEIVGQEYTKILELFESSKIVVVVLLNGLLLRIKRDIADDFIVGNLVEVCNNAQAGFVQDMAVQILANTVNKVSNDDTLHSLLQNISNKVSDSFLVMAWITKALYMRNYTDCVLWLNKLFDTLEKTEEAAAAFKILMSESIDALSSTSYCNINILYRQKLFIQVTEKLLQHCDSANHLTAFGYLLEGTPYQIFQIQFRQILKLLVLCLDSCDRTPVLLSVLDKLKVAIENADKNAEEYMEEILPRLLKLAEFKQSMKVRIVALQCIRSFTSGYPVYKLLTHKQNVVTCLGRCLDDPKRLVRKEAVDARSAWFLIDAPM